MLDDFVRKLRLDLLLKFEGMFVATKLVRRY
jgi:hypothetical protein